MVYQFFVYGEKVSKFPRSSLFFFIGPYVSFVTNRKNIKFQVKKVLSHIDPKSNI